MFETIVTSEVNSNIHERGVKESLGTPPSMSPCRVIRVLKQNSNTSYDFIRHYECAITGVLAKTTIFKLLCNGEALKFLTCSVLQPDHHLKVICFPVHIYSD